MIVKLKRNLLKISNLIQMMLKTYNKDVYFFKFRLNNKRKEYFTKLDIYFEKA
jgi:hypothetical protein